MKLVGEVIFPPRSPGEPIPPAVAVSRLLKALTGHPLLPEHTTLAVQSFHWSFSIVTGAIYGVVAEFVPFVRIGYGAGFGLIVLLLTHETNAPVFRLFDSLERNPFKGTPKRNLHPRHIWCCSRINPPICPGSIVLPLSREC